MWCSAAERGDRLTLNGLYRWPLLAAMGLLAVAAVADMAGQPGVREGLANLAYVSVILGVALAVPAYVRDRRSREPILGSEATGPGAHAMALSRLRGPITDWLERRRKT